MLVATCRCSNVAWNAFCIFIFGDTFASMLVACQSADMNLWSSARVAFCHDTSEGIRAVQLFAWVLFHVFLFIKNVWVEICVCWFVGYMCIFVMKVCRGSKPYTWEMQKFGFSSCTKPLFTNFPRLLLSSRRFFSTSGFLAGKSFCVLWWYHRCDTLPWCSEIAQR